MEQGIYVGAGGRRGIQVRSGAGKRGRFLKCELKGQFRAVLLVLGNSFALQGPIGHVLRPRSEERRVGKEC